MVVVGQVQETETVPSFDLLCSLDADLPPLSRSNRLEKGTSSHSQATRNMASHALAVLLVLGLALVGMVVVQSSTTPMRKTALLGFGRARASMPCGRRCGRCPPEPAVKYADRLTIPAVSTTPEVFSVTLCIDLASFLRT